MHVSMRGYVTALQEPSTPLCADVQPTAIVIFATLIDVHLDDNGIACEDCSAHRVDDVVKWPVEWHDRAYHPHRHPLNAVALVKCLCRGTWKGAQERFGPELCLWIPSLQNGTACSSRTMTPAER